VLGGPYSDDILEGSEEEFMDEFKAAPRATEERVKWAKKHLYKTQPE